jgi:DNA-binding GntR family transcriptional regulator
MNEIIEKIELGQLQPNTKLPTEKEYCDSHHISRITVRKALEELERRKYIYKVQGKGSFVSQETADRQSDSNDLKFVNAEEAIEKMGRKPSSDIIKFEIITEQQVNAATRFLQTEKYDYLYYIEKMLYADAVPIMIEKIYLNFDRFPMIKKKELVNKNLFRFLNKKYDLKRLNFQRSFSAMLVDKALNKRFRANVGDAAMKIITEAYEDEKPICFITSVARDNLPMFLIQAIPGKI